MDLGQIETVMIYYDNDYNYTFWKNYYNYFSDPSDANFSLIEEALRFLYSFLPSDQQVITTKGRSIPNFKSLTASEQ